MATNVVTVNSNKKIPLLKLAQSKEGKHIGQALAAAQLRGRHKNPAPLIEKATVKTTAPGSSVTQESPARRRACSEIHMRITNNPPDNARIIIDCRAPVDPHKESSFLIAIGDTNSLIV
jgi:hypothetical protein